MEGNRPHFPKEKIISKSFQGVGLGVEVVGYLVAIILVEVFLVLVVVVVVFLLLVVVVIMVVVKV